METYFLSRKLISGLIRHDRKAMRCSVGLLCWTLTELCLQVEWSLWKMAGARLMKTFFKSEFLGLSA